MFLRPTYAVLLCLSLATLTSCGENDTPTTEGLVKAASHGDESAMQELENQLREKVREQKAPVDENDVAIAALYSSNPQDLIDVAQSGNAQASFLLGQRLMSMQDDSGKEWMQKAVNAGYPEAMYFVGKCKFHGSGGFEIDAPAGLALLEKAAADGHAQAAFDIGVAYRYGIDVEKNTEQAMQWYEQAQASGFAAAADELRQMRAE